MLVDALAVFQPQALGNLAAGGRQAVDGNELLYETKDLKLLGAWGGHAGDCIPDGCMVCSLGTFEGWDKSGKRPEVLFMD